METESSLQVLGPSNWQTVAPNKSSSIDIKNTDMKQSKRLCKICGDKGIGFNFGVQTCESCKAFFRRNALLKKEFKCPFENRCEINIKTRKYCQKCRIKKCLLVGMRKSLILTKRDKQRNQISDKYVNQHTTFDKPYDSIEIIATAENPENNEADLITINQDNILLIDFFDYFYKRDVELLINKINSLIPIDHPYDQFINFVCNKAAHCELLFHMDNNSTKVNIEHELKTRLEELNAATSTIFIKYEKIEENNYDIFDAFKASEGQLIKMIKMAKVLKTFKGLSIDDQIVVLKSNIKEMLLLWDMFEFDAEKECIVYHNPETQTGLRIYYQMCSEICGQQISDMFKKHVISFQRLINNESDLFSLLMAIALYKPAESLREKYLIRNEYLTNIEALKEYLRQTCADKCQAQAKYIKLMIMFEEMYLISPVMFKCFDNIDTSKLTKFFREVFGIQS